MNKIPFVDLRSQYESLQSSIQSRMSTVLEHGQYIMGPEVSELEEKLAQFTGSKHCITAASGTEALLISLMALELEPGDEVITTPFSFIATVEVVVLLGLKPVFVDVDLDTCNIDPKLIEQKITSKTRVILPVSLYGQPANMEEINSLAERVGNIVVIEDAAQSFGATYQGRRSCNLSSIGCTSFFPSKPLGCYGDGGAIFTNEDDIAQICRELRVHGQSKRYVHTRVGVGGRMDTLQCAIVLAKLDQFEWEIGRRIEIAEIYNTELDRVAVRRIQTRADRTSVFAQYTILVNDRDSLQEKFNAAGIPTAVHYPTPLNEQSAYSHLCCSGCTPNAKKASETVLSLPMGPYLDPKSQSHIIETLTKSLQSA